MEYSTYIAHFTTSGPIFWVALFILFFLSYIYLRRSPWINLPPGLWSLPVLGSVPFLPSSHIYESLNMLRNKYGDVFTVYLTHRMVVVNGYSAIRELLVKQGHLFADRPDSLVTNITKKKEEQLVHVISDLYAAGSDTTTSTLRWLIAFMALNPGIQSKVQAEIDEKIGQDRVPKMADRPMVPYTEAVLSETQRLGEIAGLNLPHAPVEDVIFRGFMIPKGTTVITNFHSIHCDPAIYPEPEKFNPSHFLDDDGKFVKREELTPFSMGKRVCLGEGLARMELFLFFTRMMQRFTFVPVEGSDKPSYDGVFALTYQPKPYKIIITSR